MSDISIGILGGDNRYKLMKEMLESDGYKVYSYCNRFMEYQEKDIDTLLKKADILVGPIPCARNGRSIALNDCSEIEIETFFDKLRENNIRHFFCGAANDALRSAAKPCSVEIYDFFEMDEVAIKNAIPTAEGAIQTAMQESGRTIFGSKAIVLGYGRCGKVLAHTLKGLGAETYAACRKASVHAEIFSCSIKPLYFSELKTTIQQFDFVFSTVPAKIADKDMLECMNKKTILIDLAQAPGGVDYNAAAKLGIKAVYCPGLPGRVAPITAAEILKDALLAQCRHIAAH